MTEVVPWPLKALIAGLGAVTVMLLAGSLLTASRARRLARQRESLLRDVGALQGALLPAVPNRVGALHVSAAYRPADGPCAGGDFYDVFPLPGGAVGAVVGDMSGHGRDALAPTAFLRYTVRAHIEAGLGPRAALKLVGEAFERTSPSADFATVLAAVYEPGSGILTYAAAGHPPPIVAGPSSHQPIVVASSPPIGLALRTGLRQTTISLPPGSLACLYTDGLVEARRRGGVLGDARLAEMLAGLGPEASAEELVRRVAAEADHMPDDLAVCLLRPARGAARSSLHLEELEVAPGDVDSARRFLEACGVPAAVSGPTPSHVSGARSPRESVLLRVALGQDPPAVEVLADDAARPPATRRRQAQV